MMKRWPSTRKVPIVKIVQKVGCLVWVFFGVRCWLVFLSTDWYVFCYLLLFTGRYTVSTACMPCQSGLYQDKRGQFNCSSCPIGFYSKMSNLGSAFCNRCEPGRYQIHSTADDCEFCGKSQSLRLLLINVWRRLYCCCSFLTFFLSIFFKNLGSTKIHLHQNRVCSAKKANTRDVKANTNAKNAPLDERQSRSWVVRIALQSESQPVNPKFF